LSTALPLVSIVTPCLNPGERLRRCLDSVVGQTYPHVEHVIVDGGSTDGTSELLRARGLRFVSEPDDGQTEAINKGFALARGELLGWLNADDVLTPSAVELAVAAFTATPGAGWVYGDCDELLEGERQPGLRPPPVLDAHSLDQGNLLPQPGTLVARWALDRVGALDQHLQLAMDYDLWLRLLDARIPSVYVPQVLAVFELHATSKTGTTPRSEFVLEEAIAQLRCGRDRAAARTAARAALIALGERSERPPVEAEIAHGLARIRERASGLDARLVRAFAYAELAQAELFARPRGFRHLFRPQVWLVPETRKQLLAVLGHASARRLARMIRPAG
jgi:hypothetical protein